MLAGKFRQPTDNGLNSGRIERQSCFNREGQPHLDLPRTLNSRRFLVLWSGYYRYLSTGRQRLARELSGTGRSASVLLLSRPEDGSPSPLSPRLWLGQPKQY